MDLFEKYKIARPSEFSQDLEIMLAEAHNDLRLIIDHHLKKLGFNKVRLARDGRQCLAELQAKPAQVALIGDDLPSIQGLDILRELREEPSITRETFVLISRPLQKNEVMLAVESGIDDLLIRPVAPNDILPKLRSAYQAFNNLKNPERVYEFAKARFREQQFDLARGVYEDLSAANPKAARPHVGLARVFDRLNQSEKALQAVNEAIQKNPQYVHGFSTRAEIHIKIGDIPKAVADFKKASELSPLSVVRYEKACEIMLKHELIDECIEQLELGVKAGLDHPFIIERLGFCYFTKKDFQKALRYLKQAVRIEPENTSFLNSLAICYRDSKQFDSAIEVYNQILKKENDNYLVLFNKAIVHENQGKNDEAIKIYRRILKINPDYDRAKEKLKSHEPLTQNVASLKKDSHPRPKKGRNAVSIFNHYNASV